MKWSSAGPSVHEVLQARILEGVAILAQEILPAERLPFSPALQECSVLFELQQMPQGSPFTSFPASISLWCFL